MSPELFMLGKKKNPYLKNNLKKLQKNVTITRKNEINLYA